MSPQMESVLRDSLVAEAGEVAVATDPWTGFARRERRHRRARTGRRVALAVVVAAVLGAQGGVVPLPGWAPGIAIAGRPAALADSPVRGSLAGDTAWLEGMRREIDDVRDPGELWKVGDRTKIKFVYAADVGDRRLCLVLVPLRFGFVTDWSLMWYSGRTGAAPSAMTQDGTGDGAQAVESYSVSRSDGPGVAVVVGPAGSTVSLARGFTYTPEGRVEHGKPVTFPAGTGLAEQVLPPLPVNESITATVVQNERTLYRGGLSGSWAGEAVPEFDDATSKAVLGDSTFDRGTFRQWVNAALQDARLPAAGTTVELRWTGTVNAAPAALFTLHRPGDGVLAYALHGSATSYRQDLRVLLPAAGAGERPLAWRMRADGKDDRTDQLIVTAPAAATRVVLTVAGAAPVPVPLDRDGFAGTTLAPDVEAAVTAYRADGSELGTTPVLPFESNSGGLPGDDRFTRIVD